jgi:hypothetical protein
MDSRGSSGQKDKRGKRHVCIGHRLWRRRFGDGDGRRWCGTNEMDQKVISLASPLFPLNILLFLCNTVLDTG